MASRSGSRRVTLAASGPCSCKNAAVSSALPASMSDSKSDKLAGQEKDTPAPSVSAPAEVQIPKYTKADLLRILKIFLETKGQTQLEVPRKQPLKAKLPDVYSGKLHMDCFYFCQQCEDHFKTAGATGLNRTLFAASFL